MRLETLALAGAPGLMMSMQRREEEEDEEVVQMLEGEVVSERFSRWGGWGGMPRGRGMAELYWYWFWPEGWKDQFLIAVALPLLLVATESRVSPLAG